MEKMFHLPLEPYKQRYTENLHRWEEEAFKKKFPKYQKIMPDVESLNISSGSVLDTNSRPTWCLKQIETLLNSNDPDLGVLYFSDFYTSGLDALAYSKRGFKSASFCWAQTFDIFDFTYLDKRTLTWMRPYELMAMSIYDVFFVASEELKNIIVGMYPAMEERVEVVGLPFNSKDVSSILAEAETTFDPIDVVYTSRWDVEKNPSVFLDLVEARDDLKFAVCTGWDTLRGTDGEAINRALRLEAKGKLTIHKSLDKPTYYSILEVSNVQFNCALQDWVSFTLLEALTMGCTPLYPNFRSFPETLMFKTDYLYAPGIAQDAMEKLDYALENPFPATDAILSYHDGALSRISSTLSKL